jgi:hypothetical protein
VSGRPTQKSAWGSSRVRFQHETAKDLGLQIQRNGIKPEPEGGETPLVRSVPATNDLPRFSERTTDVRLNPL